MAAPVHRLPRTGKYSESEFKELGIRGDTFRSDQYPGYVFTFFESGGLKVYSSSAEAGLTFTPRYFTLQRVVPEAELASPPAPGRYSAAKMADFHINANGTSPLFPGHFFTFKYLGNNEYEIYTSGRRDMRPQRRDAARPF